MNYELRLILTKFIGSRVVDFENADGVLERGVFIPMDNNGLYEKKDGAIEFSAFVTENMHSPNDHRSHYVKLKLPKDRIHKLEDWGYKAPYLGSLKISHPKFEKDNTHYYNHQKVKKIED